MQERDLLRIGCRLIGVYCIIVAIPQLAQQVWLMAFQTQHQSLPATDLFRTGIAGLVQPVVAALIGGHLLLGEPYLERMALRSGSQPRARGDAALFVALVRLLGLYLVAFNLPRLVGTLLGILLPARGDELARRFASSPGMVPGPIWDTLFRAVPTVCWVAAGFYLIVGGDLFRRLAYRLTASSEPAVPEPSGPPAQ